MLYYQRRDFLLNTKGMPSMERAAEFAKWLSDENSIMTYKQQNDESYGVDSSTLTTLKLQLEGVIVRLSKIELEIAQLKANATTSTPHC